MDVPKDVMRERGFSEEKIAQAITIVMAPVGAKTVKMIKDVWGL